MPIATPQGTLDFKSVDKVTFVGASSNTVIDTTTGSLGVGVGVGGPTSKLHVVGNAFISSDLTVSGTGALTVPNGTTGDRPAAATGMIRYNSTTGFMEGYAAAGWAPIAQPPTITGISPLTTLPSGGIAAGWNTGTKIQVSDAATYDRFGTGVSMNSDGTMLIVGAYSEGGQGTSSGEFGAAYIYTYSDGSWGSEVKIQAYLGQAGDHFGAAVSMSGDGTRVIVGAYDEDTDALRPDGTPGWSSGAVYIFALSNGSWSQEAKIQASDVAAFHSYGENVSMSSDGTKVIVGANSANAAYIYTYSSGSWGSEARIVSLDLQADDQFGMRVCISGDGTKVIVGARLHDTGGTSAGAAYIFALSNGSWSQEAKIQALDIQASDMFGESVSMNSDGTKVIVGVKNEDGDLASGGPGAAYIYTYSSGSWGSEVKIVAPDAPPPGQRSYDHFGCAVSMSGDGTKVIVGADLKDASLVASYDGSTGLPTGGTDTGAAYVFTYGSSWDEGTKFVAPDPEAGGRFGGGYFGSIAMSRDGTKVLVGAHDHDIAGQSAAGAAYIFDYQATALFDASTQVFTATGTGIVSGSTVQLEGADGSLYSVSNVTPNAAGTQVTFKLGSQYMTPSEYAAVNTSPYHIYFEPNTPRIGGSIGEYGNFFNNPTTVANGGLATGTYVHFSSHPTNIALAMAQMSSFGGGTPPNCPSTQLWTDQDINGTNTYKIVGIKSGQSPSWDLPNQPYKVKVNSTSGLTGTSTAAIGFPPTWTTAVDANLNFDIGANTTQILAGTDGGGGSINRKFEVAPGSNALPAKVGGGTLALTEAGVINGQIAANQDGVTTSVTFRLTDTATGLFTDRAVNIVGTSGLYSMTFPFTFTNAGATGRTGPTLSELQDPSTGYGTSGATTWVGNSNYLNVTTQGIQEWTVPASGTYRFIAFGAQGAHHAGNMLDAGSVQGGATDGKRGGYGARGEGRINLTKGEVIKILVGQAAPGPYDWGGGGGGTFVVKSVNNVPLLCIGGGSGLSAYSRSTTYSPGEIKCDSDGNKNGTYWTSDASASEYGNGGFSSTRNTNLGYGGTMGSTSGGGFYSSGTSGAGFLQGGLGGSITRDGGFGGGGAGQSTQRAGAGGGWTGGNGPDNSGTGGGVSAGGGTYVNPSLMTNRNLDRDQNGNTTVGGTSNHGYVIVEKI
jgi:hypothetical protein